MIIKILKCANCENNNEDNYNFCKNCITKLIRVCTCNKKFIEEKPSVINIGNKDTLQMPDPMPEFFLTQLKGNIYHILGCRGCQHKNVEISIHNNFDQALKASIFSCIYQKYEEHIGEITEVKYEYLSDSLDPVFDDYLTKNNIRVGEPAEIKLD